MIPEDNDPFWQIVRPYGCEFRQVELDALYDSLEQRLTLPPFRTTPTSSTAWHDAIQWFWKRRHLEGDDWEDI